LSEFSDFGRERGEDNVYSDNEEEDDDDSSNAEKKTKKMRFDALSASYDELRRTENTLTAKATPFTRGNDFVDDEERESGGGGGGSGGSEFKERDDNDDNEWEQKEEDDEASRLDVGFDDVEDGEEADEGEQAAFDYFVARRRAVMLDRLAEAGCEWEEVGNDKFRVRVDDPAVVDFQQVDKDAADDERVLKASERHFEENEDEEKMDMGPALPAFCENEIREGALRDLARFKERLADRDEGVFDTLTRLQLSDLKYTKLYPKTVRKWVEDVKTPPGVYDVNGFWVPLEAGDAEEHIDTFRTLVPSIAAARRMHLVKQGRATSDSSLRTVVPEDVEGRYRFGVTEDELEQVGAHPKLRALLSFEEATQREINQFRIREAIKRWQRKPGDTGSTAVQIAVLTEKIQYLSGHMEIHRKDRHSNYGFQRIRNRRRALLRYLKRKNTTQYYDVVRTLNLRDPSQ
jgi:small subunit ribosomal protein S15